jgi:hypothetical protein
MHKAWTALAAAAALEAVLARPVVPLFWSHGEDHDRAEIASFWVHRHSDVARIAVPIEVAPRTVESIRIDDAFRAWAEMLRQELRIGDEASAPVAGEGFGDWSARCVASWFAGRPLVLVAPAWIRRWTRPVLGELALRPADLQVALAAGEAECRAGGVEPPIRLAGQLPIFELGEDGSRRRLSGERAPRPEAGLSADALLRAPLLQRLLPVLAHVLGPGERGYFAQGGPLFDLVGAPRPGVLPRLQAVWLREREARAREALGLDALTLLRPPAEWPAPRKGPDLGPVEAALAAARSAASGAAGEAGAAAAAAFGARLADAAADLARVLRGLGEEGGLSRARHRLASWVRPRGQSQDRVLSPYQVALGRSVPGLLRLLDALDPFDPAPRILILGAGDALEAR